MLFKRKLLIFSIALASVATGGWYVRQIPNVYRASALLMVDGQRIPERYVSATVGGESAERVSAISQRVLSDDRLREIVEIYHLASPERLRARPEEVLSDLRRDLLVRPDRGWADGRAGSFRVIYQSENRDLTAAVANHVADLFVSISSRQREATASDTSAFLRSQLDQAKQRLEQQEAVLAQYKLQHSGALPQQENALLATLGNLQLEIRANQDAINRAQQEKVMIENSLTAVDAVSSALSRRAVEAPERSPVPLAPTVATPSAPKKSEVIQAELDGLLMRYTDEHPEVRRARVRLQQAKQREAAAPAVVSVPTSSPATPATVVAPPARTPSPDEVRELERTANLRNQSRVLAERIEKLRLEGERLSQDLAATRGKVGQMPIREVELSAVTRDYDISRVAYQSLLEKWMSAQTAAEMERQQRAEKISIVELAKVPLVPIKPQRRPLYGLVALVAIALGVICAIARELYANTLLGEWELPPDVAVLGRIPPIKIRPEAAS